MTKLQIVRHLIDYRGECAYGDFPCYDCPAHHAIPNCTSINVLAFAQAIYKDIMDNPEYYFEELL